MVDLRGLEPSGVNGGLQTYVEWLLPWLVAHHRNDFTFLALAGLHNAALVSTLLGSDDAVCVMATRDAVWRTGREAATVVSTSISPRKLAEEMRVDALYAPLGPLPFADPQIPSIALVADMLHRELPEYLKPEIVIHRENYLSPIIRDATLIQCISLSAEDRLQHHYPETQGRTFVTYLPVQSRLQKTPISADSLAVPQNRYFLYPANFWPHKNHRLLLTAFQDYVLKAGAAAWDLVLCGSDYDGNLREIQELANGLGLGGRIHLPGYVDEATLATLWRQASALIFPSLHEGFGIPLLEAMSVDIPVLSANGYSLPEVAGDAALYFDPRDASQITARMLQINFHEEIQHDLIQRGRSRLHAFDAAAESAKLVEAFQRILSSRIEAPSTSNLPLDGE